MQLYGLSTGFVLQAETEYETDSEEEDPQQQILKPTYVPKAQREVYTVGNASHTPSSLRHSVAALHRQLFSKCDVAVVADNRRPRKEETGRTC